MERVVILGTSGSGKTTFAKALGQRLQLRHIELDALHWGPNWTAADTAELLAAAAEQTAGTGWAVDGNYLKLRELIWRRADTIIWLDYPMKTVFARVCKRTLQRWWHRQVLWSGNRENLRVQLFSTDSLFLWVIQTWRQHRQRYPKLLREQVSRGKKVLRFGNPAAAELWLQRLGV